MKVATIIIYNIALFLIKIGDVVISGVSRPFGIKKTLLTSLKRGKKHFKIKRKLKRNQTLFEVKKPRPILKPALRRTKNDFQRIFQRIKHDLYTGFYYALRGIEHTFYIAIHFFSLAQRGTLRAFIFLPASILRIEKRSRRRFILEQRRIEREKEEQKNLKPGLKYKFKLIFWGAAITFVFICLPIIFIIFLTDLPSPRNLSLDYAPKTTKIFDRNGALLYEIYANQNRTIVPLANIPQNLIKATIAIEDRDFYKHPGFDVKAILRALASDLQNNDLQGGSTITQQLVKSVLLTPEATIVRKVKEIVISVWAEHLYTKDQILAMYFNYVPYGGNAWGIEAASNLYFGKDTRNLTLAESAFLAGLPRAPSVYSPYSGTPTVWEKRQKEVLEAMVKTGAISKKQKENALVQKLHFQKPITPIKAPHFVMYVKNLLVNQYGLSEVERGGLQVRTTLDLPTQEKTQRIVSQEVAANQYLSISNGAALVTNPKNGDILAMVGSKNYFAEDYDGNVNLTTALRQPGSTIKIVTYALALSKGFTETSTLQDTPLTITTPGGTPYTPVNYDGAFHGNVPLRIAFANSFNIPAVRLAQRLGVDNLVSQGRDMGITTWDDQSGFGVSLTLGAGDVRMVDMATVYGTVANGGVKIIPNPILEVKDTYGKVIYKKKVDSNPVIDPGIAFILSDILSDNNARRIEFGPNSPLNIPGHKVSVKTGTTDNKRDNWTIGYTPNILVATWVGNNDNTPMSQTLASGITGAAPMWNKIITSLLLRGNSSEPDIPDNIVRKHCGDRNAYYIRGTETGAACSNYTVGPTPTPTGSATAIAR